jgi:hypothetical protein
MLNPQSQFEHFKCIVRSFFMFFVLDAEDVKYETTSTLCSQTIDIFLG